VSASNVDEPDVDVTVIYGGAGTFAVHIAAALGAEVTGVCSRVTPDWCAPLLQTGSDVVHRAAPADAPPPDVRA
jgi:NADPH:quinone reductase-like Zn-dependent oxidoreductase